MTPAMKQYYDMKEKAGDAILFFRMGDFYEMFDEDAKLASKLLGLTLTTRGKTDETATPLAGIPYHAAEKYLVELTNLGHKIAICEQISDPKLPGIVERDIVRIITPGTAMFEGTTNNNENRFLVGITGGANTFALSALDLSTGEFFVSKIASKQTLLEEVYKLAPTEVLLAHNIFSEISKEDITNKLPSVHITERPIPKNPEKVLLSHYQIHSLESLSLQEKCPELESSSLLLEYVYETQKVAVSHIKTLSIKNLGDAMILDENTIRNLELFQTSKDFKIDGSVYGILAYTTTGGGGRLLRRIMLSPLIDKQKILIRHLSVEEMYKNTGLRKSLRTLLGETYDLERIIAKLSMERGNARDLIALKTTLRKSFEVYVTLKEHQETLHTQILMGKDIEQALGELKNVEHLIEQAIADEPPLSFDELGSIKSGYNSEIDELRLLQKDAKTWLVRYTEEEQKKSGISTLKVKYTGVFGYFLEVTKSQAKSVPEYFQRRQTLVNAERYTTPELQSFEEKILTCEDKLRALEYDTFCEVRSVALSHIILIHRLAEALATLDVFSTFAEVSYRNKFAKPEMTDEQILTIEKGRHPVIESILKREGKSFVPNNVKFSKVATNEKDATYTYVITGPNMAGKSTFLRQIALSIYLAQIGCYVPAECAKLPVIDRIFTRIGAQDNVSRGSSTFMVEMQEAAQILQNATDKSLIILDELGRGTSTYDGLSLAWAILEYLHNETKSFTLFATHYHELINVVETLDHAKNLSALVSERNGSIVFLHKIVDGGATKSYGIEVAKLAGIHKEIIKRAEEVLLSLETTEKEQSLDHLQPTLFSQVMSAPTQTSSAFEKALKEIEIENLTPIDTMLWVKEQQQLLHKKSS